MEKKKLLKNDNSYGFSTISGKFYSWNSGGDCLCKKP